MPQNLSIKLQVRISPEQEEKLLATCAEWSTKKKKVKPSDVVRALIDALVLKQLGGAA